MEVELDETAISIARRLAEKRHDSFSHDNFEDTAFGKSSYDVHLIGAKAEVAFSEHYGLFVDMKERLAGDEYDFEVRYDGEAATVDVKSSTYRPPWLQVRESKMNSDYYVATFIEDADATSVEIIGWASRDRVLNGDLISSPAGGDHYNYRLWEDEMAALPAANRVKRTTKIKKPIAP